jgi:hypothetical protein
MPHRRRKDLFPGLVAPIHANRANLPLPFHPELCLSPETSAGLGSLSGCRPGRHQGAEKPSLNVFSGVPHRAPAGQAQSGRARAGEHVPATPDPVKRGRRIHKSGFVRTIMSRVENCGNLERRPKSQQVFVGRGVETVLQFSDEPQLCHAACRGGVYPRPLCGFREKDHSR